MDESAKFMKEQLLEFLELRKGCYENPELINLGRKVSALERAVIGVRLEELNDIIKVIKEDDFYD